MNRPLPMTDDEVADALQQARAWRAQSEPTFPHPSGRKLHYDNTNDVAAMRSLAIGRAAYAAGGAIEQVAQSVPPRFAIQHAAVGLAGGGSVAVPAPVAAQPVHDGGINDIVASALSVAREHLARGGGVFGSNPLFYATPGTAAPVAALGMHAHLPGGGVPTLPLNLAAAYARHGTRMRARYDDGGDAGGGDSGSGDGSDGSTDGGYGAGLGNYGIGASAGVGNYGIGGFSGIGGAVGGDSDPTSTQHGESTGFSSMAVAGAPSSSIGNTAASIAGMGSNNTGVSYGGASYGNTTNGGSIGPAGIGSAGGFSGDTMGTGSTGGLSGFGNFGSSALGDGNGGSDLGSAGFSGGLNGASNYGLNGGYSSFSNNIGNSLGDFGSIASTDGFASPSTAATGYGDLTGFNASNLSNPAANFGDLSNLGFGNDASLAENTGSLIGMGVFGLGSRANTQGAFGSFGNDPLGGSFAGSENAVDGVGAAGTGAYGTLGTTSMANAPSVGVLGGFNNLGVADAGFGSGLAAGTGGFTSNPAGYGKDGFGNFGTGDVAQGGDAATPASVAGTGVGLGAAGVTGDPTAAGDEQALTIHGLPGFAAGQVTGDDAPAVLATQEQVRNYALADMAANFGSLYGKQYGLSPSFSFSNPNAVASVVGGAQLQESSDDPAAINKASLATGLGQMLGTGTWGRNNIGPYSGSAADPSIDRESSMLGAIASPYGVNPASLDPRAVGIDAAQSALSSLPGAYNNQEAFGLAQLAANPMYKGALNALNSPNGTIEGAENSYTRGFEGPSADEANLAVRQYAAGNLSEMGDAQLAALGGYPAASVTYGAPSQQAVATTATPSAFDASEGLDSVMAQDYARALANPAAYGVSAPEDENYKSALNALGQESYNNDMMAAYAAGFATPPGGYASGFTTPLGIDGGTSTVAGNPTNLGSNLPAAPTYSDPDAPPSSLTIAGVPPHVDTTSEPQYAPYEQGALTGAINLGLGIAVPPLGLANAASGLLGYGTVGSYITGHSQPGSISALGGTSGRSGDNGGDATVIQTPASAGTGPGYTASTSTGSSGSSSSTTPSVATAQQAYLSALKNLPGPGPTARKAKAVPLVAPTTSTASFYNPLTDPTVLAALNVARSYRTG